MIGNINPFPAIYEFISVFPSAANKYMSFLFLIRSLPATNIFVQNLNAPACMHIQVTAIFNVENIFNNLKYIAYYCISSTFTRILSEYHLSFQFVVKLDTLDVHVSLYIHFFNLVSNFRE